MKDLKEESSQLGYGDQWSEVKAEIAKPAAKEYRHCETPGCVYEVTLPDRFCDVCERERHERLSHARSIPLCYQWATFDSAELPGRCGGTSMVAKGIAAIDALIAGKSPTVVLHGPAGSGKTSIAAAMLRRWLHKERGLFVDALDIGRVSGP